jgi:hypothetical protein
LAGLEVRSVLAGAVLVAPFLIGSTLGVDPAQGEAAFTFSDRQIAESSGLVLLADQIVTTNDSGDEARVFVVDVDSGQTVREVRWDGDPRDVEALAAAGHDAVWVGDIGDNREVRDSVSITRVDLTGGEQDASYDLVYPDGAHDAEALVTHPLTGQVSVITKGAFAGSVMQAPLELSQAEANTLTEVGRTPGIVTDAEFLPGGGAVLVRTYSRAVVLEYPSWRVAAGWDLPEQRQGEGVAVDGTDLLLSSEGLFEDVLRVPLPAEALAADWRGSPIRAVWQQVALAAGFAWL